MIGSPVIAPSTNRQEDLITKTCEKPRSKFGSHCSNLPVDIGILGLSQAINHSAEMLGSVSLWRCHEATIAASK